MKSAKNVQKGNRNRSLRFEPLESRWFLAGGIGTTYPVIPESLRPSLRVINPPMKPMTILPGATNVVLGKFTLGTGNGRTYAQINSQTQFVFVPGFGENLAGNLSSVTLRVDANNNPRDGCEKVLGEVSPSWESDMAVVTPRQNLWIRQRPLRAEVVGKFSACLTGKSISVELAGIFGLRDLGGKEISADAIKYIGVDSAVHKMLNHTLTINQREGKPFSSVSPGKKLSLIEFDIWGNTGAMKEVSFSVTNPDNLVSKAYLMSQDVNYDGYDDEFWTGSFKPGPDGTKGTVSFNLGASAKDGGRFRVTGCTNAHAAADNTFQMSIIPGGVKAYDLETGVALKGVMVNDSGAGQVQEWLVESTLFALVERPVLVITGGSATQESVSVTPGTKVVVASFDVKNTGNTDATFFSIVLAAQKGDVRNCESYTLWQVNSDGTRTFAAGGCVSNFAPDYNSQYVVHLGGIFTVPVGKTVHYEVTAVASQTPYYPKMLQVYLNPRWVDVNDSDWNTLGVDKVFYWFGEHPLFTISNDLG